MNFTQNSTCSRCGKNSLLTDEITGEQFCSKCGYVISEKSEASGPERRSFSTQGGIDTTRTGAPTSLTRHDKGLSTVINPQNRDSSGKLNQEVYATMAIETKNWGITIVRVELKEIEPPDDVQETMNMVIKAENDKQSAIDFANELPTRSEPSNPGP